MNIHKNVNFQEERESAIWVQLVADILNYVHVGEGTPEGVLAANVGHIYLRTDGGAGTTLYVKESGTSTTGWVGK